MGDTPTPTSLTATPRCTSPTAPSSTNPASTPAGVRDCCVVVTDVSVCVRMLWESEARFRNTELLFQESIFAVDFKSQGGSSSFSGCFIYYGDLRLLSTYIHNQDVYSKST